MTAKIGAEALKEYLKDGYGRAADLAKKTGLPPPYISKMKNGKLAITLYHALMIEIHTVHALTVEILCPSQAHLVAHRPIAG